MSTESPVLFETLEAAGGRAFGRATLNSPANLNALSLAMIDRLLPQLDAWAQDDRIAGVVLDAAGAKSFCAGGDVVALSKAIRSGKQGEVPALASDFFEREYRLDHRIFKFPKPLLCWGEGIVMGGGVGLLAPASHRVVTASSRVAMPEISIGLYPDVGGSWFLARLPRATAWFLALTGVTFNATDAVQLGLADIVIRDGVEAEVLHAVRQVQWTGRRDDDSAMLAQLLVGFAARPAPVVTVQSHSARINELIGRHDGLNVVAERLRAAVQDPDPWIANAAKTFVKGSPTSAALSIELQSRARGLSMADVYRLEYQASVGCCAHHDFAEGVRALLIDKDKAPRWQPARVEDITPEWINAHLEPRFSGPHPLADLID